jgi:23S rRNA (adenine2503-C2)-methyltransferase
MGFSLLVLKRRCNSSPSFDRKKEQDELIPVNYVPARNYVQTPREQIFEFETTLKKRGINVTIRRKQGSDIDAACGQLRAEERKEETR